MDIKKKLVQIKDEYLKVNVVVPALVTGVGAGVAYYMGFNKGYKVGIDHTFKGLSKMFEAAK